MDTTPDLCDALLRFVGAFEVVFGEDWEYTKWCLRTQFDGDTTFLEPGVRNERNDWKARGALLAAYRDVRDGLIECGLEPRFSP